MLVIRYCSYIVSKYSRQIRHSLWVCAVKVDPTLFFKADTYIIIASIYE